MDILTNSTKFTEVENDTLNSIEVALWIIVGLAICAILMCIYRFIDTIVRAIRCLCKCLCKMLTCCCQPYRRLNDDDD